MKRAIIYARVSTDDQRNNYSIPSQIDECKKYIDKRGYHLVGNRFVDPVTGFDTTEGIAAFVDDYSSLELNRPGLDAAYEYLERYGYDVVVVLSIDRLDRDPYKLRTHEYGFIKGGAQVEYVKGEYADTPDGNFMKTVVAAAAKLDNDWRIERFSRGKRQKARRGLFVGGRAPYGYTINRDYPGGLKVDEEKAQVVRDVYDAYINKGLSLYGIADMLNRQGVKPLFTDHWGKSSTHHILNNTAYIGTVFYNKYKRKETRMNLRNSDEWIEISITPIIDIETFNKAQELLARNKEIRRKQTRRFYLLSGLVFCNDCEKPFLAQAKAAGNNRLINDALSYRHRISQGHCRNQSLSARRIEPIVWEKTKELLLNPSKLQEGYNRAISSENNHGAKAMKDFPLLEKERANLEKRLTNLTAAYIDSDIRMSKVEYLEQRKTIEDDLRKNKKKLQALQVIVSFKPTQKNLQSLVQFSEEIRKRLTSDELPPTPQNIRQILQLMDTRIYIGSDGTIRIVNNFGMNEVYSL